MSQKNQKALEWIESVNWHTAWKKQIAIKLSEAGKHVQWYVWAVQKSGVSHNGHHAVFKDAWHERQIRSLFGTIIDRRVIEAGPNNTKQHVN